MRSASRNRAVGLTVAIALLLLLVLLIIMRQRQPGVPDVVRQLEQSGLKVSDGDTFFDLSGQKVRLLAIDTPEEGDPFHDEATTRLAELLLGSSIAFRFESKKYDKYGRLLALVYADSELVNRQLLVEGLAHTYFFPQDFENILLMDSLCAAQREARELSLGIWSLPQPPSEEYYIGNPRSMRFHRPGCRNVRNLDTSRYVRFFSRDEALDLCYSPCRNCNP